MVRFVLSAFCAVFLVQLLAQPVNTWVDPFIGTAAHGHTHPAATLPFGMVQLGPDTRPDPLDWDGSSGYHYTDSLIYGFSHTHLSGTGVGDYCDILFMPFCGPVELEPRQYASHFRKKREKAGAGYYSVFLDKDRIQCDLTATARTGVHRYTFPQNREKGRLLIDLRHRDAVLESSCMIVNNREIAGHRVSKGWAEEQHIYFVARFSKPFFNSNILDMTKDPRVSEAAVNSKGIVTILDFYHEGEPIVVTVGISGTSIEGARRNLEAECNHFDFEKVKTAATQAWESELSKITFQGGTDTEKRIFYTALYHSLLAPCLWSDADGQYRGRDNRIHPNPGHAVYHVFSLWDTYRACLPLQAVLCPDRVHDFVKTFLRQYEDGGLLPVWELSANETNCMIGNHAIPAILAAKSFNLIDRSDYPKLLEAMKASIDRDTLGLGYYRKQGYVPAEQEPESVSKTLEYALDEYCTALFSGKRSEGPQAYDNFVNLFDPETHFFRARANGSFYKPFDPLEVNFNYTEGNAWHYRFAIPFEMSTLLDLMGGTTGLEAALDSMFNHKQGTTGRNQADITGMIGQYAHGNEPCHHIPYLYNYVGKPEKQEQILQKIRTTLYTDQPDGLCGNDDCGQMSAWYVWSAIGLYPVTYDASGTLEFGWGKPVFNQINLGPGHAFYLKQREKSGQLPKVNYVPLTVVPKPYVKKGERVFAERQTITLGHLHPNAAIYYTLDGSTPTEFSAKYNGPFEISQALTLRCMAVQPDGRKSGIESAVFNKKRTDLQVKSYATRYSPQYTARGDGGLVDGLLGGPDFRSGGWQGFEGVNLDLVIDLGKKRKVSRLAAHFLQEENSWIFMPTAVRFEVSADGKHFKPLGEVTNTLPVEKKGNVQQWFTLDGQSVKTRYIRIIGVARGQCPETHKGAGYPCWIFIDEVGVE